MIRKRQLIIFTLILAILVQNVQVFAIQFAINQSNPNIRRAVGLAYYDIWQHADGHWQNDEGPGSLVTAKSNFSYTFERPVKEIKLIEFTTADKDIKTLWDNSREDGSYNKTKPAIATLVNISKKDISGKGTKTISISAELKTKLDAREPEKPPSNANIAPGVIGQRYYIPYIIEVELEEVDREVIVQHFDLSSNTKLTDSEVVKVKENATITRSAQSFG